MKTEHDREDVLETLDAVLASQQFRSAQQIADFLNYVVHRTLEGDAGSIKAYSIAVDALGRPEDFDPQASALVRVTAARLRQTLAVFNASEEAARLPLRIEMRPGSYVPEFVSQAPADPQPLALPDAVAAAITVSHQSRAARRLAAFAVLAATLIAAALSAFLWLARENAPPTSPPLPRIDVVLALPDKPYPDWFNWEEVASSLNLVMDRFDEYRFASVRALDSATSVKPTDGAHYLAVLTAHRRGDAVRLFARLERASDNSVVWSSQQLVERPRDLQLRDVPEMLGRAIAPVVSPYGVIFADISTLENPPEGLDCIVRGYRYFFTKSDLRHGDARQCAEELVTKGVKHPSIHAMLTFLYLDELREGRNPRERDPLPAALQSAQRAVEISPQSARAHQALAAVYKVQGLRDRARRAIEKAEQLNPFDADIVGDYGAWLISVGELQEGRRKLDRVEDLLEIAPSWMEFYRFLIADQTGDLDKANRIAGLINIERAPLLAMAAAIGAAREGKGERLSVAHAEIRRSAPKVMRHPLDYFLDRGFSSEMARSMVSRLRESGLDLPET